MNGTDPREGARLADAVDAALGWWRDAGLDFAFGDAPQDWLASAAPAKATRAKAPAPPVEAVASVPPAGGDRAHWPTTLEAFAAWWLAEPSLAPPGLLRVAPSGSAGAPLMILVAMPEAEDGTTLLSGRGGRLVDAMLAAMGLRREDSYLASILPARIAAPDWTEWKARRLGDVLQHHVALARPQRLLVFGKTLVSALIDHDSPHKLSDLPTFNHEGGSTAAISTYDLDALLARPAFKASLWNRWLEWTGNEPT
ncbi:uracil-DNA glycosylase family protein [Novosphingobium huizhouense]|uniref:uracil-DNA glycosylase family protein n=1 Tax=Novosphingobium huizhouense TaxID=2866625 RepID=UPI001CD8511A|nr:uracil-DNA glycosylase family protein [Novosphingobium huizhouense]